VAESEARAPGFSERDFYLREFRGRTLAIVLPQVRFASAVAPVLLDLVAGDSRVVLIAREPRVLEGLGVRKVLDESHPRLEAAVWRELRASMRAGVAVPGTSFSARCREVAWRLGVFKLVWLDPGGGLRAKGGERLSFVHREELRELLADPAARLESTERLALWREVAALLDADVPAVNVCAPEAMAEELFTWAGSGTLFTRERYVTVQDLSVDDFDAAFELIRRGTEEGFLASRSEAEVDEVLATGFGAFVEGRHLAGIGALVPSPDRASAEIASLYTLTRFLGEGVGFSLVAHALEESARRGYRFVFSCTTSERVGAFFERNGFRAVAPDELPAAKWEGYDPERRARVRCYRRDLA
jgi:amino-acid N-acetyltransferase